MTLVKKTFLVFLLAFLIQILLVGALVTVGFDYSMNTWEEIRREESANLAAEVLSLGEEETAYIEAPWPIIIYNSKMEMVGNSQTPRPMGRMGARGNFSTTIPVLRNGEIIGYYSINIDEFKDDVANEALFSSMLRISIIAFVVSFLISLLAAFLFSRSISKPADVLSNYLRNMSEGNLDREVHISGDAELVEVGAALETLRKRMIHEQGLRAQWGQDIAHDLRTPVASLTSQIEGMEDGVLAPNPQRFDMMLKELKRIETLIGDLETLMKLESPEISVRKELISSSSLLSDLSELFRPLAQTRNMDLKVSSEVDEIAGDEGLLTRALGNLIVNAIHYGDPSTCVEVSFESGDDALLLKVHNEGPAIPSEEQDKVFDRLYRGEFSRNTPGSGLGLTIVSQIAALHKGEVVLESDDIHGTTFIIRLPASQVVKPV